MAGDEPTLVEVSGCLYERPTAEGQERDWRVDPATGATFPFDLTVAEIASMRFDDVPIKIEHTYEGFSSDDEVGRVREVVTDPETGYTAVRFALHDTVAGRTVARLVKRGTLNSLSLGHLYDPATKGVSPSEVSVCFNGARAGSCLYKEVDEFDRFKSRVQSRIQSVMASAQEMPPTSDPAPTNPDKTVAAAAAADTAGIAAALNAPEQTPDLVSLLETCTQAPGVDEKVATQLFQAVAEIVNDRKTQMDEQEKQRAVIAELEKQVSSISEKNKNEAEKIVATMNALLSEYVGEDVMIASGGDGDSALKEVAFQVPVLASALNAHKHANAKVDSLAALRAGLAADIKKALSPWKEETPASASAELAPVVAVNASARHAQHAHQHAHAQHESERPAKMGRFASLTPGQQRALQGFSSFGDGTAPRLTADMLPNNFNGVKN